jgi:hypothetical protein
MYCCNFFSDVLPQFVYIPMVVDVCLALEVYPEEAVPSA